MGIPAEKKQKNYPVFPLHFFYSIVPIPKIIMHSLHEPNLAQSNTLSLPKMQLFSWR